MSTPLRSPRRISETTTCHGSVSSFRTASSPEEASWTAYPASSSASRIPTRSASLSSTSRTLSAIGVPHRDLDDELGSFADFAVHVQDAAVGVHDLLGHRQPDSGPGLFRGEEGNEDPVLDLRGDSGAVVTDVDPEKLLLFPRLAGEEHCDMPDQANRLGKVAGRLKRYSNSPLPLAGVHGVGQDVRQRLLEQGSIHLHQQVAVRGFLDGKLHPRVEVDHSRHDTVDESIHPDRMDSQLRRSDEVQAFPDDVLHFLDLAGDHADRGKAFLVPGQMRLEETGVDADAGDRVADLV